MISSQYNHLPAVTGDRRNIRLKGNVMGQSRLVGVGVGGLGRLIYTHTSTLSSPVSTMWTIVLHLHQEALMERLR